jgi:hypothetical protein
MPAYSAAVVERAALNRDLKVEVHGNPFNISPTAFAGQVAAQMNQTSVVQTHSARVKLYYTETQNSIEFMTLVASMTAKLFPADPPRFRRSGEARLAEPPPKPGGK